MDARADGRMNERKKEWRALNERKERKKEKCTGQALSYCLAWIFSMSFKIKRSYKVFNIRLSVRL